MIVKIFVEQDESLQETEVTLRCRAIDEETASIIASLRMHDTKIMGSADHEYKSVPAREVLFAESVDGRTFVYTTNSTLEVALRLYELEDRLASSGFVRAAKNCLVNLNRISAFRPYVGGRLLASLDNGEDLVISRKYAPKIKASLHA